MKLLPVCFILLFSTVQAKPVCFDNWFCITIDENQKGLSANVHLQDDLPVVVTVTSPALEPTEVTLSLMDTQPQLLGKATDKHEFWHSMHVTWTAGMLNAKHNNKFAYGYPLKKGNRNVVQGFNGQYSHQGASKYALDFAVPEGTPVLAARAGKVIDLEGSFDRGGPSKKLARYANYIVVLHDDGTTGEYYHLKKNGVLVTRGDLVKKGQHIGLSGNTGFSSLPHLHFGVYRALPHGKYQSIKFRFEHSRNH